MTINSEFPVVIFLYKRPELTLKLLTQVVDSGVKKIYIFADGPKNTSEKILTDKVKSIVTAFTQAKSELVLTVTYALHNIGLQNSIVTGLTQVFSTNQAAIILEDDCIPNRDFYPFTSELLIKYQNESKIMSVTGTSVGQINQYSYNFSKYELCWGWATWSRAWKLFDPNMALLATDNWAEISRQLWPSPFLRWYFTNILNLTKVGQVNSWAFKWSYSHFIHGGLAIVPNRNLVSNVGFDRAATNTRKNSPLANRMTEKLNFPLIHPPRVRENVKLNKEIEKQYYTNIIAWLGMFRQVIYRIIK